MWRWRREKGRGQESGTTPETDPWGDQWQDWLRRSPVGTDLLAWWRDEGGTFLAHAGPEGYRARLAELISRASPRDVAALGIGCTRRIDRPCRDPKTCSQDPPDGQAVTVPNRTGPIPGACGGFKDCWTTYGINVKFTPDDRHRAVHIQDPSDRCMLWIDGVRVAEGLALEHSGYWASSRFYVVETEGPKDHPEQGLAMGNLCWNILSLVVHDVERATTRVLVPEATETWTCPVLRVDGEALRVYPDYEVCEDASPDRVLPIEPLPST